MGRPRAQKRGDRRPRVCMRAFIIFICLHLVIPTPKGLRIRRVRQKTWFELGKGISSIRPHHNLQYRGACSMLVGKSLFSVFLSLSLSLPLCLSVSVSLSPSLCLSLFSLISLFSVFLSLSLCLCLSVCLSLSPFLPLSLYRLPFSSSCIIMRA